MDTATAATVSIHDLALKASKVPGEADHAAAIESLVGRRAIFHTFEGDALEGVIEAPIRSSSGYPIVRFADGKWGRCDDLVTLLD